MTKFSGWFKQSAVLLQVYKKECCTAYLSEVYTVTANELKQQGTLRSVQIKAQ